MAFKNGKLLAMLALAASATTLGLSMQSAHAEGEGGVSGSAAFQGNTGGITLGAVSGAVGRMHAITNATIDGSSTTAAAFGIGSAGSLSFTAADGELSGFTAGSSIDSNIISFTNALGFPIGLTASTAGLSLSGT